MKINDERSKATLDHSWRLPVSQAIEKYFPGLVDIDTGDSPYEILIYQENELIGSIMFVAPIIRSTLIGLIKTFMMNMFVLSSKTLDTLGE